MYTEKVKEFHQVFNHPVLEKPQIPAEDRVKLRIKLLREELDELEKAAQEKDIVEVTDALCDIQYVLSGAILEFGLEDDFNEAFKQVHESNMSKTCATIQDAVLEQQRLEKEGITVYVDDVQTSVGECFVVLKRVDDHKVIKPSTYKPVDLSWVKDGLER